MLEAPMVDETDRETGAATMTGPPSVPGRVRSILGDQRTYQLIRQPGPIADRRFEIEFLDAGAEAYCFTFG
jgi:hypothetical protein